MTAMLLDSEHVFAARVKELGLGKVLDHIKFQGQEVK